MNKRPELLAPAGSPDAFHAAIDAGADAVYLGIDGCFNARLRAKNFTMRDLAALLPHAHSRNVKIYVTLNTLIKQSEIKHAINVLYQLDQLGIDAVIIADIGLMRLASTHFPQLRIHGSTQAAIHNAYGASFLKTLGVKRVVLARELSLDEIRETTKKSQIETEVFIHGALCYSISGQCLASSFIGGASGNRGKCTQVCRRRFKCMNMNDGNPVGANCVRPSVRCAQCDNGYFFSPNDLQAATHIGKLIDAGVASFKIEGRMKGAEYVSTVVKAYRRIIDNPHDINIVNESINDLRYDFGREKTTYYLNGRKNEIPIDPSRPSGTGILVGTIIECGNTSFTSSIQFISGNNGISINTGDRLRVQPQNGFEGTACKVSKCEILSDDKIEITVSTQLQCNKGDHVFLIGKADAPRKHANIAPSSINLRTNYPNAAKIANSLTPQSTDIKIPKPKLWFRIDNANCLDLLNATPCQHLIFDADINEINKLLDDQTRLKTWRSRVSVALPVFIGESEIKFWRDMVEKCLSIGIQSFTISNLGHFPLVNRAKNLIADATLCNMNRFTQKETASRGVDRFVYSYEDEYLNIRDAANPAGIVPIYGKPPLFISRMPPPVKNNVVLTDPHGNKFTVSKKNGLHYTLSAAPMCLFAKREKLSSVGIENFLIDLCFHEPSYELVSQLVTNFKDGKKIDGATIFNFKAGLR